MRNESFLSAAQRHDWIVWIDSDVIINDMSFDIPFKRYTGKDLVIYDEEKKDSFKSNDLLNSGLLFIRNTNLSRDILRLLMLFGRAKSRQIKQVKNSALVFLVNKYPVYRERIYVERLSDLNVNWERLAREETGWDPFLVNFNGCEFCMEMAVKNNECINTWAIYYLRSKKKFFNEILHRFSPKLLPRQ